MGHHAPVNSYTNYVNKWKQAMEEAYTVASRCWCAAGKRSKSHYDLRAKSIDLQCENCKGPAIVLHRNLLFQCNNLPIDTGIHNYGICSGVHNYGICSGVHN